MMIFRFVGQIPVGKFEFTCTCGHWNQQHLGEDDLSSPKVMKCAGCDNEFKIWQQKTHWHMTIKKVQAEEKKEKLLEIKRLVLELPEETRMRLQDQIEFGEGLVTSLTVMHQAEEKQT